jgi:hypothetical protein
MEEAPPELPLGADIGSGSDDDPHAFLLSCGYEPGDIPVAGAEVIYSFLCLVEIPEELG